MNGVYNRHGQKGGRQRDAQDDAIEQLGTFDSALLHSVQFVWHLFLLQKDTVVVFNINQSLDAPVA